MKPLSITFAPACKFCNDEGEYVADYIVGNVMKDAVMPCICKIEDPGAVRINILSPMEGIRAASASLTKVLRTPSLNMAWASGQIISTTLPSAFMTF